MAEDYKVKDINLADFGRKEISLAETEMPGLMALRKEYKGKLHFKGSKNFRLSSHDNSNSCINRDISGAWCRS
jgi:S-adenosylhomocysteine hydrolase